MDASPMGALRLSKDTVRRHSALEAVETKQKDGYDDSTGFTCSTFSCVGDTNACQYCGTILYCTM